MAGHVFGEPRRKVDDWDKVPSFDADDALRRSTSSLGAVVEQRNLHPPFVLASTQGEHNVLRQLVVALVLVAVVFLMGALNVLIIIGYRGGHWGFGTAIAVARCCVGAFWLYGLYRRQNWLRWLTIVCALSSVVFAPWSLASLSGDVKAVALLELPPMLTAAALLTFGKARQWFKVRA